MHWVEAGAGHVSATPVARQEKMKLSAKISLKLSTVILKATNGQLQQTANFEHNLYA